MRRTQPLEWVLALATVVAALVGCGGGGVATSPTGARLDPALATAEGMTVSGTSLMYYSAYGVPPAAQTLTGSLGDAAGQLNVTILGDASTENWLSVPKPVIAEGAFKIGVGIKPGAPANGLFSATLRIIAKHADDTAFAYRDIHVTYYAGATGSSYDMSFSSTTGAISPPSAQNVGWINLPASTKTIMYTGTTVDWLKVVDGTADTALTVAVTRTDLPAGTYTAAVFIIANSNTVNVVRVTYYVNSAYVYTPPPPSPSVTYSTSTLAYTVKASTTDSDYSKTANFTVSPSGATLAWTAKSSVPWLKVSPGGDQSTAVTATLVAAEVNKLVNGHYTGTVDFKHTINGNSVYTPSLSVTLDISVPTVDYIAPYVAQANTAGQTAIVRGAGLIGITTFALGNVAVTGQDVQIVSDTEAHIKLPSNLATASYPVTVPMSSTLVQSRFNATLEVVDVPAFANNAIPLPASNATRQLLNIVYDAQRQSLLAGIVYPATATKPDVTGEILKYSYNQGAWTRYTPTPPSAINDLGGFAMSTDGKMLVAVARPALIYPVDAVTLQPRPAVISGSNLHGVATANDGNSLITADGTCGVRTYSVRAGTVNTLSDPAAVSCATLLSPGASADGSVVAYYSTMYSYYGYRQYRAADGKISSLLDLSSALASTGPFVEGSMSSAPRIDKTGATMILSNFMVYKSALPGTASGTLRKDLGTGVALSPAGDRAYICCTANSVQGGKPIVSTFDLTNFTAQNGFAMVGSGTELPADPGGTDYRMTMTPDGGTLFIMGTNNVVIMGAPR